MRKLSKLFATLLILAAAVLCLSVPAFATQTSSPSAQQTYMTAGEAVVQLREAMKRRESPITLVFRCAEPESEEMAQTLFYSAIAHTGVPTEGDYLYRHISGLKFNCETESLDEGYLSTTTYTITYRTTAEQEAQVDEEVARILDSLDVYDGTDYEKVLAIYNYLCSQIIAPVITGTTDYTAYGALIKKSAVCQGFSSAFYRLSLELGVDNRLLSGKIGSIKHGWNIVAIDGFYYNVDATKDAGFQPDQYRYFLKCDLPDHIRDATYETEEFHGNYPMGEKDYVPHVHTWDEGTVTEAPTCMKTGVKTFTCTGEDCQETETEDLPKLTDHTWDDGIVTKEATGYEEGIKTYTCTVCSDTEEKALPRNGWERKEGKWYYHVDGVLATGWIRYKNRWYFLHDDGVMSANDWVLWKKNWYYLDANGVMVENDWVLWNNRWYYLDTGGVMKTGWLKWKNVWFYLDDDGIMQIGWVKWKNVWFYLDTSGAMVTGWRKVGGIWYYFDESGAMLTGWRKIGGVWYYFHASGAMATGTVKLESKTYRFSDSGAWIP